MSRWRPLEEEVDHSTERAANVNVTVKTKKRLFQVFRCIYFIGFIKQFAVCLFILL